MTTTQAQKQRCLPPFLIVLFSGAILWVLFVAISQYRIHSQGLAL